MDRGKYDTRRCIVIIKYDFSTDLFVGEKQDYDHDIVDIGKEAMRVVKTWISDVSVKLSDILSKDDEDLAIVGDSTFGAMKDKLNALIMSGKAVWSLKEQALYNIDQKIRESTILLNKINKYVITFVPLEYFTGFDCKLTIDGKTYQAWAVSRYGCSAEGEGDIYVTWVIPEEPIEGLTPEKKKKGIFKRGD